MKKWLKKHGRWLWVGLGCFVIAYFTHAISTTTGKWEQSAYAIIIALWALIILLLSGGLKKFAEWWERD